MIEALYETGKKTAGRLIGRCTPRYSYRNCVFILAHMRCGSTALSNIVCSRPEVSGYGEAHVRHDGVDALGLLALNQMRRGGWKPRADHLFDKILHSRHDSEAPSEFFGARAIFVARRPGDAVHSIVRLFGGLGRDEYRTQEEAAHYYVRRLADLERMWRRFPARRRIGLTHEALLRDPDIALAAVSGRLGFNPPLENRYVSLKASRRGGGGDPVTSGRHTRIEAKPSAIARADLPLDIPAALAAEARQRYERLCSLFREEPDARQVGIGHFAGSDAILSIPDL